MPDNVFINPYTFVPFPTGDLVREAPAGHAGLTPSDGSPRYMGRIDVTAEALTRVLVRGGPDDGPPTRSEAPIIPGSSLHGALRAMHEMLAGGCLRVFNDEFIPSYRDAATRGVNQGWELAIVEEVEPSGPDAGRPTKLTVCSEFAIARAEAVMRETQQAELRSGTRLTIDGRPEVKNGRNVFPRHTPMREDPHGAWVMLLTDGNARSRPRNATRPGIPYYVTLGNRGGDREVATRPDRPAVSDDAWRTFQFAARGARDFVVAIRGTKEAELRAAEVACARANWAGLAASDPHRISWDRGDSELTQHLEEQLVTVNEEPARTIGKRAPHRPWLFPGLPVWVQTARDGSITAIKLSQIWRHAGGSAPAAERVPSTLLPCDHADQLCPTCRLFGAADTTGRSEDEAAAQNSYRGHVRVGDLVPAEDVELESLTLAPTGAPRPGSGQFYLTTPPGLPLPGNEAPAAQREWGARADRPEPRRLRGRKAYWRTTDRATTPRWKARRHQQDTTMVGAGRAFPVGTRMTATITFDGLTRVEIGALLACLEPGRVLTAPDPDKPVVFSVGGGKPFGFGACRTSATLAEIHSADSRWGSKESPTLTEERAIDAFKASAPVAQETWPALAAACTLDHVDPDIVWYPPGAPWAELGSEEFDKGYEFWSESVGRAGSDKGATPTPDKPLIQLPDVLAPRQDLKIITKRGRGGRR